MSTVSTRNRDRLRKHGDKVTEVHDKKYGTTVVAFVDELNGKHVLRYKLHNKRLGLVDIKLAYVNDKEINKC